MDCSSEFLTSPALLSPAHVHLPGEVLGDICAHIDRSTAVSVSRASQQLHSLAEPLLWQDLPLHLGPHLDLASREHPLEDLRAKLAAILSGRVELRKLARKVKLDPMPGAVDEIIKILADVQGGLRELVIDINEVDYHHEDRWEALPSELIDTRFAHWGLSFASLSHIRLGKYSLAYADCIPALCKSAPNLVDFELDVTRCSRMPLDITLPTFTGTTRITHLQITMSSDDSEMAYALPPLDVILALLRASPLVEQLAIGDELLGKNAMPEMINVIGGHEHLRDLILPVLPAVFQKRLEEEDGPMFAQLRRLVLPSDNWTDMITTSFDLPALETLVLSLLPRYTNTTDLPPSPTPNLPAAMPMHPNLVYQLLRTPTLRFIHSVAPDGKRDRRAPHNFAELDAIEQAGSYTGTASSYRYGDQVVFHARFRVHYSQLESSGTAGGVSEEFAAAGQDAEQSRGWAEEGYWYECTDFKGMVVPLGMLERMREVEGVSKEEWQGRGRWVKDETWRVLMDWVEVVKAPIM